MADNQDRQHFESLLRERFPGLSTEIIDQTTHFRELVLAENQKQNLTRLLSPEDFVEGHVLDVVELLKSGLVSYPAMDLGSGVGVPGLLAAIFGSGPWILAESEQRKAEFLRGAAQELGLSVKVFGERAEKVLATQSVKSVVARAVGPVERIYGWIRQCSTWNNLVLLKGPKWEEEWKSFQMSRHHRELNIQGRYSYKEDHRVIVFLGRNVPRGTKK